MLALAVVRPRRWKEGWWTMLGAAAMLVLGLVSPREAVRALSQIVEPARSARTRRAAAAAGGGQLHSATAQLAADASGVGPDAQPGAARDRRGPRSARAAGVGSRAIRLKALIFTPDSGNSRAIPAMLCP